MRPQSGLSHFSYTILFVIASFPVFLISIVALLIFTGNGMFGLFPTPGAFPVLSQGVFWRELGTVLPFILLPLILIVLAGLPSLTRQVHNIMVMELQKEYVQAAILRGIPIKKIVNQYAWKNALGVLSVYLGRLIPALISGSIVIESIFNLPGMGSLLIGSVISRDWPVVFGIVFLGGSFTVLGLMFADLVLYRVDPNILKSGKIQAS